MKRFFVGLFLGFLLSGIHGFAQKKIVYSAIFQKGIIIPHHKSINYLIKDYIYSADINIGHQTSGTKDWHSIFRYPIVGGGCSFSDFKNSRVFGKAYSFYSFFEFPVLRKKNIELSAHFAAGIAYLTKPSEAATLYSNFVIGSHFNAYLHVYLIDRIRLTDKFQIQNGFGITHFSNGATKKPNLGLNLGTVSAALVFTAQKSEFEPQNNKAQSEFKRSNRFSVFLSGGYHYYYPPWDKIYINSSLNLAFERNLYRSLRSGIGLDIFYDNCLINSLPKDGEYSYRDYIFPGIFISFDIVLGRFSFVIHQGWHPQIPVSTYPSIYNRWALKYQFTKHFAFRVALKSNLGTAQFVEYGFGYTF